MNFLTWVTRRGLYAELGIGWWKGSHKLFACGRTYYDGWWYGFRLGPFYLSISPYPPVTPPSEGRAG